MSKTSFSTDPFKALPVLLWEVLYQRGSSKHSTKTAVAQ